MCTVAISVQNSVTVVGERVGVRVGDGVGDRDGTAVGMAVDKGRSYTQLLLLLSHVEDA